MLLASMPKHPIPVGVYKRKDGEEFDLVGTLFESPTTMDFWLVPFIATHKTWGQKKFTLMIPKKIAGTVALANVLSLGAPMRSIENLLDVATSTGMPLTPVFSADGWVIA